MTARLHPEQMRIGPGRLLGMATLVAFHAHPDDECLLQSGSLAKAARRPPRRGGLRDPGEVESRPMACSSRASR